MPASLLFHFGEPHIVHFIWTSATKAAKRQFSKWSPSGQGRGSLNHRNHFSWERPSGAQPPFTHMVCSCRRCCLMHHRAALCQSPWLAACFQLYSHRGDVCKKVQQLLPYTANVGRNVCIYTHVWGVFAMCILNVYNTLNIQYIYINVCKLKYIHINI